jgi:hypothetical protein
MRGHDGKWNGGIHINIVGCEENGPPWIHNIKSRGKNYPYHKFTWGSITWGSSGNPYKGYGTGKTTTKHEAKRSVENKASGTAPYSSASTSYSSASMSHNQDTTYPSASYSSSSTSYNQDTTSSDTTYSQEAPALRLDVLAGGTDGGAYDQNTSASLSGPQWVSTGSDVEGQRYRWDGMQYTNQFA